MTQAEVVQMWLTGANEALETAELIFASKKYNHDLDLLVSGWNKLRN